MEIRTFVKSAAFSALVLLGIGSSSALAEITVDCSYSPNKKVSFCLTNENGEQHLWRCDKQKNGTWRCSEVVVERTEEPNLKSAATEAATRVRKKK
jgi:hypothetical protein